MKNRRVVECIVEASGDIGKARLRRHRKKEGVGLEAMPRDHSDSGIVG